MTQDFWFNINHASVYVDRTEVCVIRSKNGIMMNVSMSVKNQMIGVLAKMIIYEILARVIVRVIKHVKWTNI